LLSWRSFKGNYERKIFGETRARTPSRAKATAILLGCWGWDMAPWHAIKVIQMDRLNRSKRIKSPQKTIKVIQMDHLLQSQPPAFRLFTLIRV
jgi:hypothetical protein